MWDQYIHHVVSFIFECAAGMGGVSNTVKKKERLKQHHQHVYMSWVTEVLWCQKWESSQQQLSPGCWPSFNNDADIALSRGRLLLQVGLKGAESHYQWQCRAWSQHTTPHDHSTVGGMPVLCLCWWYWCQQLAHNHWWLQHWLLHEGMGRWSRAAWSDYSHHSSASAVGGHITDRQATS